MRRERDSLSMQARVRSAASLMLGLACLVGCAQLPTPHAPASPMGCETGLSPAENTRLAAIEQMMGEGKFYAVLAQLDAMGIQAPKMSLVRADALRKIGKRPEARAAYEPLLDGCFRGRAQHGLGLLAASEGRHADSLSYLRQARASLPLEPNIRNDYGYALLLDHQFEEAQFEFLTVLDLSPGDPRASRNLVLLTLLGSEPGKADALSTHLGIDATSLDRLKLQAEALKTAQTIAPNTDHSE